jgi:single-stranded DNA-specific DHH superfamily exonuclease
VFLEVENNVTFRKRYSEIRKKYDIILSKVNEDSMFGNLIFFDYSGDLSISAEIANELCYKYPGKYIAVAFIKSGVSNISLRGKDVKKILEKILKQFDGASGGGHEDASGARIRSDDLAKFRETLQKEVNKDEK